MNNTNETIFYVNEDDKLITQIDFLTALVKLTHITIANQSLDEEFHFYVRKLLKFVMETEDSKMALLLMETLHHIHSCTNYNLNKDFLTTLQLCNIMLVQFKGNKQTIYLYALIIINSIEAKTILSEQRNQLICLVKDKLDANVYECFNMVLNIQLMDLYLKLDVESCKTLYVDIMTDLIQYNGQLNEEVFGNLLWYGFMIEKDYILIDELEYYNQLIQSDKWLIKFYRFVKKQLTSTTMDEEKIARAKKKFLKQENLSMHVKQCVYELLSNRFEERKKELQRTTKKNKQMEGMVKERPKENLSSSDIVMELIRLSPKNLPTGVSLNKVNKTEMIKLAIYESDKMFNMIKTLNVEVYTCPNSNNYYVNKRQVKEIKNRVSFGYINIINNVKQDSTQKLQTFAWPTTEITGNGFESDSTNGLNEKSALRKLGYQITDSTREKRWLALRRAVPTIGLKKVAYTIAGNIKLRKGQRDGQKKYSFAISEWEYDLNRLKQTYYKKDFKWPNY